MTNRTISISPKAQTKMALHAAKHGFSNPIHGIVLGNANSSGLTVADVVPVCHEVPTKPIVDMALRLTDASLSKSELKIVGWYTANANVIGQDGNNENESPNAPACKIASSMAEIHSSSGDSTTDGKSNEDFVLLLVSTNKLVNILEKSTDTTSSCLPVCSVFEKDKSRTFTQRVNSVQINTTGKGDSAVDIISRGMDQQLSSKGGIDICDFVDHLDDGGRGDWIDNEAVNKLVGKS